jgi:CRISPR/Cas system CSM-associated protein Csm3 (group 7 of RAMP superfamily)
MHVIELVLKINFQSKWHCGSGEASLLADRLIRRDARAWPFIPGSTLKGVVRESCEKLSRTFGFPDPIDPHQTSLIHPGAFAPLDKVSSPVDAIFGNRYEEGALFFRDARLSIPSPFDTFFQSRIRMHRRLGTAVEKHLFDSEYALSPLFTTFQLTSRIDGYHRHLLCSQPGDPPLAFCLLVAGVLNVDRLGGDKSTGSGCVEITLDSVRCNGNEKSEEEMLDHLEYYVELMSDFFPTARDHQGRYIP